jgi:hypothetical protein
MRIPKAVALEKGWCKKCCGAFDKKDGTYVINCGRLAADADRKFCVVSIERPDLIAEWETGKIKIEPLRFGESLELESIWRIVRAYIAQL